MTYCERALTLCHFAQRRTTTNPLYTPTDCIIMARLSEPEKQEIVRLLARYVSVPDVVVAVREQLGVEISRFQVRSYDPTKAKYEGGERLRAIFEAEREKYERSIEDIPIAHKAFRLNQLQSMLFRAQASGNLVLACDILERAAKEVGGVLTNCSNVSVERPRSIYQDMTPDERRACAAKIIHEALSRTPSPDVMLRATAA